MSSQRVFWEGSMIRGWKTENNTQRSDLHICTHADINAYTLSIKSVLVIIIMDVSWTADKKKNVWKKKSSHSFLINVDCIKHGCDPGPNGLSKHTDNTNEPEVNSKGVTGRNLENSFVLTNLWALIKKGCLNISKTGEQGEKHSSSFFFLWLKSFKCDPEQIVPFLFLFLVAKD